MCASFSGWRDCASRTGRTASHVHPNERSGSDRPGTCHVKLAIPAPLDAAARAATWTAAWALLDRPAPAWLLAELEQACGEPPRHYPDRRHLGECLVLWTRWRTHCERPVEVAVALWFHDAVYATRHGAPTGGVFLGGNVAVAADADALLDIDLAILGACRT